MCATNSKEYWNKRFETGDWDAQGGKEQSLFFAQIAYSIMPDFLKRDLGKNRWSVVDIGCAEGEGTAYLAKRFPLCRVTGTDFSDEAIKTATQRHTNCDFMVSNVYQEIIEADVVFSSNTLEHLRDPWALVEKMCAAAKNYVVLLLPFEDCMIEITEHINTFSLETFPLHMNGFYLTGYHIVDCKDMDNTRWLGKEILLVYTAQSYYMEQLTLKDINDNFIGEREQYIAGLEKQFLQQKDKVREQEGQLAELQQRSDALCQNLREALEKERAEKQCLQETVDQQKRQMQSLNKRTEQMATKNQLLEVCLRKKVSALEKVSTKVKEERKEKQQLQNELERCDDKYDNLYTYSSSRDAEFTRLINSRSYKFFIRFIKPPLHIGYKIAAKLFRMLKDLFTLNMSELVHELYMPFKRLAVRIKGRTQLRKRMSELRRCIEGKRVVIFPATIDWHMRLFQRPQQLALSYAKKDNTAVIYFTQNVQDDHVAVTEQLSENLWLLYQGYENELLGLLDVAAELIVSISWTVNIRYVDLLKPNKLIYEYIDELEIFSLYGPDMIVDHEKLLKMADVTVCTATKLYNQVLGKAKNPILSPNAGDYNFFAKTSEAEISPLISDKIKGYRCVLGYYGALASWFDYDLVKEVARRHSDWVFVLVGVNYDGTLDKSGINKIKNIVYVPPQPYHTLPTFLTAFDIATIPFRINEITLSTSPVKLFEYMAGSKPILTSKMPECLKYESVRTYADVDEFCQIVKEYMAIKPDDSYWEILKREALENTWDARTDQILKALEES